MGRKKQLLTKALWLIDRGYSSVRESFFKLWSDEIFCFPPARALQHQNGLLECSGCNTSAEKLFNCCHDFIAQNIQLDNRPLGEYAQCCNFPKTTRL